MSLGKKVTFDLGNIVQVEGNYRPQSPSKRTGPLPPNLNLKTLMTKFWKKRSATPITTTSILKVPTPTPPPPPPHDYAREKSLPKTEEAVPEDAPILQFRRKSVFEVQAVGDGTKLGGNDADGVGLPTGNGGGDMEGVVIRDFAEEVGDGVRKMGGCEGGVGEGAEAEEEGERVAQMRRE